MLNEEDAESWNRDEDEGKAFAQPRGRRIEEMVKIFPEGEKFSLHPWKCRTANLACNSMSGIDESNIYSAAREMDASIVDGLNSTA